MPCAVSIGTCLRVPNEASRCCLPGLHTSTVCFDSHTFELGILVSGMLLSNSSTVAPPSLLLLALVGRCRWQLSSKLFVYYASDDKKAREYDFLPRDGFEHFLLSVRISPALMDNAALASPSPTTFVSSLSPVLHSRA